MVDHMYYKQFDGLRYEIRAAVKEYLGGVRVETMDGKTQKIFTGEKDIRIGGFNPQDGKFMPASDLDRRGTVEKSVLQLDDLLVIAQIAKKTGEILAKGIGAAITKESASMVSKLEKAAVAKEASEIVTKTEKISTSALVQEAKQSENVIKDTVDDLSSRITTKKDTSINLRQASSRELKDTSQDLGDTLKLSKLEQRISANGPQLENLSNTLQPSPYSNEIKKYLGDAVSEKAAKIGIKNEEIFLARHKAEFEALSYDQGKMADLELDRLIYQIDPREGLQGAVEAAKKVVIKDIEQTYSLGEDTAKGLISYGFKPSDICRTMEALKAEGLTASQIKQSLSNELKIADYIRDKYCNGSKELATKRMENTRETLSTEIFKDSWKKWKIDNPRYYELSNEDLSTKMREISAQATEDAKQVEKQILGSSSATPALLYRKETSDNLKPETKVDGKEGAQEKEKLESKGTEGSESLRDRTPSIDKGGSKPEPKTDGKEGAQKEDKPELKHEDAHDGSPSAGSKDTQGGSTKEQKGDEHASNSVDREISEAAAREKGGGGGSSHSHEEKDSGPKMGTVVEMPDRKKKSGENSAALEKRG